MKRPQPEDYNSFYQNYIDTVNDDVVSELADQLTSFPEFLGRVPVEKTDYAYAPGKWTLKEVLGHIIDTERIMAYRLLRFSRNDSIPLAGFEENNYVKNAHFRKEDFNTMIEEFKAVRNANLFLFRSLTEEELERKGEANNSALSVRALLFIMSGHVKHHQKVIEERYL
ncbi:DinB family protein [Pedobacter sp. P351]|uniref:DinB family protein n=1 Tax=Pedobacter superstes TaxID=3133441 RepID=UPI0030989F20